MAGLVAVALLASCGGQSPSEGWKGRVLPIDLERPDFTLMDVAGVPFEFRSRTEGKLTLLFFGYTYCPDICPVHLANIASVLSQLEEEVAQSIKVVFITTDPERDTPERVSEWLAGFDPTFIGLRGATVEVNAIEAALLLPQSIVEPSEDPAEYLVGHASQVIAFSPDGPARIMYPWGTGQDDWLMDLPRLAAGVVPVPPR